MTAVALIVFGAIVIGCLFFADEIDSGRCNLACRCGRRRMNNVTVTSTAERCKLETQLSAICPWCTHDSAAPAAGRCPSKGVDIHA